MNNDVGQVTLAVQLAKLHGAEVTGVDRASKADLMRSIGADHVIDYMQEDFTANGQQYDLIFDLVAPRLGLRVDALLDPGGDVPRGGGSLVSVPSASPSFWGP